MLLTVRNTYLLNLINWGDEKMTEFCGPGRNMVWVPNKSNPTFPQIWGSQLWCRNWDFPLRWNMKSSREKSNWWFPQIWWSQWVTLQLWSGFLTLCEGKNTRKPVQKWIQMHGRANQSRNTTFEHFSLSWGPLKIPHQLTGGYGTRLSIRRQDPNNYSDTEMRALSSNNTFMTTGNLKQHMMLHSGEKPFRCEQWLFLRSSSTC